MVLLWDIIRDFYVQYIFGGTTSIGDMYYGTFGSAYMLNNGEIDEYINIVGGDLYWHIGKSPIYDVYISAGDWLSTTVTIITLVALLIGISCLMISLFKWIVRLVSLRG